MRGGDGSGVPPRATNTHTPNQARCGADARVLARGMMVQVADATERRRGGRVSSAADTRRRRAEALDAERALLERAIVDAWGEVCTRAREEESAARPECPARPLRATVGVRGGHAREERVAHQGGSRDH